LLLGILSLSIQLPALRAQATGGACAVTPDKVDGQGLNVTQLGLSVTQLGLNVTQLGLNVTGFGLSVTQFGLNVTQFGTPEQIISDITKNVVTPAWLTSQLPGIQGGANYNTVKTAILVVDDFSSPTAHGYDVRKVVDDLKQAVDLADDGQANNSPKIDIINVDISTEAIGFQSTAIAAAIKQNVDNLKSTYQHFVINMSFGLLPCQDTFNGTLADSQTGKTMTVNTTFNYKNFLAARNQATSPGAKTKQVEPVLECVRNNGGGSYSAYFGYENKNSVAVTIPVGNDNRFNPDPKDRGQPSVFGPGRQRFVFKVDMTLKKDDDKKGKSSNSNGGGDDDNNLVWILKGPDGKGRSATANPKNPNQDCARLGLTPPPDGKLTTVPVGYGMSQYITSAQGIPPQFADDYMNHLAQVTQDDPINGLQALLKKYLQDTYAAQQDGNPSTIFAVIPVAASGNFRNLFGGTPLKPALFAETIATGATLGDFGARWTLSHDGNLLAPGAGYPFEKDAQGKITRIGAGTSYAAPFLSTLAGLWLTYPSACTFGNGTPPLAGNAASKSADVTTPQGGLAPLNCQKPQPKADLALTKTPMQPSVTLGGDLQFVVAVQNNGPDTAKNVVVTDTIPNGLTLKTAAPTQGSCTNAVCNLGDIASTKGASIIYTFASPAAAQTVTNTASVKSDTADPNADNNKASAKIEVKALEKVSPVLECVTNFGNGTYRAYFGYNNNNAVPVTLPIGPDNQFATDPKDRGQGTTFLPGRQQNTFFFDFDGTNQVWQLNGKTATASNNPAQACADVGITAAVPPGVIAGQNFVYTVTVTNTSQKPVDNVVVSNTVPAGLSVVHLPAQCSQNGGQITCNLGTLAGGANAVLTFEVVTSTVSSKLDNTFTVASAEGTKGNPNNNSATASTTVAAPPACPTLTLPTTRVWSADDAADVVKLNAGGPVTYAWEMRFPIDPTIPVITGTGTLNTGDSLPFTYPPVNQWGKADQYGTREVNVTIHFTSSCGYQGANWDRWYQGKVTEGRTVPQQPVPLPPPATEEPTQEAPVPTEEPTQETQPPIVTEQPPVATEEPTQETQQTEPPVATEQPPAEQTQPPASS
jgi:uncharacterized repeat protein (TIGR01451 family)